VTQGAPTPQGVVHGVVAGWRKLHLESCACDS
jgi:hypothetical protein